MAELLVQLEHVSVTRNGQNILQDVSFSLNRGEIVTLIGPNGAGKTTLVKTLLGLIPATSGNIVRPERLRLGYMPQRLKIDHTFPLSVQRFLTLVNDARELDRISELTGIRRILQQPIQSVSGGELQRVLLARAILRRPDLLVLDEPAQGVDITGQSELYQLIQSLRDELHCGILMVSHDLHLVMAATDKVICLNQHICCSGHPEQVSNDPAYLELFGKKPAEALAVYHHHHDHQHTMHGDVIHQSCGHDHSDEAATTTAKGAN